MTLASLLPFLTDSSEIPTGWESVSLFIMELEWDRKKKVSRSRQDRNHQAVFKYKYAVLIWINSIFLIYFIWDFDETEVILLGLDRILFYGIGTGLLWE